MILSFEVLETAYKKSRMYPNRFQFECNETIQDLKFHVSELGIFQRSEKKETELKIQKLENYREVYPAFFSNNLDTYKKLYMIDGSAEQNVNELVSRLEDMFKQIDPLVEDGIAYYGGLSLFIRCINTGIEVISPLDVNDDELCEEYNDYNRFPFGKMHCDFVIPYVDEIEKIGSSFVQQRALIEDVAILFENCYKNLSISKYGNVYIDTEDPITHEYGVPMDACWARIVSDSIKIPKN